MQRFVIAVLCSYLLLPLSLDAQWPREAGCVGASEHIELWPGRDSAELARPEIAGVDAFARRVVGRYHLLLITTEGGGIGKRATEGIAALRFRGVDSGLAPSRLARGRFDMEIVVHREGYLHAELKPPVRGARRLWRGLYQPPNTFHFIDADPNELPGRITIDEAAAGYYVGEIDDSLGVIRGRWSGGIAVLSQKTRVGVLTEHPSGYFCARRLDH